MGGKKTTLNNYTFKASRKLSKKKEYVGQWISQYIGFLNHI